MPAAGALANSLPEPDAVLDLDRLAVAYAGIGIAGIVNVIIQDALTFRVC
jgi:hypothetical protein